MKGKTEVDVMQIAAEHTKSGLIQALLESTCETICDNFCKYRDTGDDECICDYVRDGQHTCPLDFLY